MKLFLVTGIRHHAIVLAENGEEAIRLAVDASTNSEGDTRVLFGYVGDWESPDSKELRLPNDYKLVKEEKPVY